MNILLTGGNGFVGKNLVQYFNDKYDIFAPSHNELDILCLKPLQEYIGDNKITHVIHAAAINERWYSKATAEHMYKNILMFENIALASQVCQQLIMFGSGAEFDNGKCATQCAEQDIYNIVPNSLGGLVKSVIAKRINSLSQPNCYYLRFFGGFGPYEEENRFITYNLSQILNNKHIVVHQNRLFDFIYVKDLAKIIHHILQQNPWYNSTTIPCDINCVYKYKYTLLDIAHMMKQITNSNATITISNDGMDKNYIGNGDLLASLGLPLIGLFDGIKETYTYLLGKTNS